MRAPREPRDAELAGSEMLAAEGVAQPWTEFGVGSELRVTKVISHDSRAGRSVVEAVEAPELDGHEANLGGTA
jgi:hypothetical protein